MFGLFGSSEFGASWHIPSEAPTRKPIALLNDSSNHGGSIINSGQDGSYLVGGVEVAVEGALHSCPISGHGITPVYAITIKSFHNSKLILTEGAISGCGALINPPDRNVFVE